MAIEVNFYEHKGARIAVYETGNGPPMLFVHCSSASHREWLFAAGHFKATRRCVLPDLIGYGKTSGHVDPDGTPIECTDADLVGFLLDRLDEPADVIGHSYGGLATLEAAVTRGDRIRSLFLVEPVAFHLLSESHDAKAWEEALGIASRVAAADANGDIRLAARIYMGYWIGRLKWAFSSRKFRDSVLRTVPKVAHEFRYLSRLETGTSSYGAITCPVTLVAGGRSTRAAHAVVDILDDQLPDCRVARIAAAGHMAPFTHRETTFDLLCEHLERIGRR